jgi:hypothetical protein
VAEELVREFADTREGEHARGLGIGLRAEEACDLRVVRGG